MLNRLPGNSHGLVWHARFISSGCECVESADRLKQMQLSEIARFMFDSPASGPFHRHFGFWCDPFPFTILHLPKWYQVQVQAM